jgi:DHA2 family multidrug resistance protein
MQHFIGVREQFHSNILGLGVQLGEPATSQRLGSLSAGAASHSNGTAAAIARAGKILGLQVRQQAFTLAITDSFTVVAWSVVCGLVVIACMRRVSTQYQQVVIADAKAA